MKPAAFKRCAARVALPQLELILHAGLPVLLRGLEPWARDQDRLAQGLLLVRRKKFKMSLCSSTMFWRDRPPRWTIFQEVALLAPVKSLPLPLRRLYLSLTSSHARCTCSNSACQ